MDFSWIKENFDESPARLRLKYGAGRAAEILQIEMRRKHAAKLGNVFTRVPDFIFPDSLSAEQATSWSLAKYHASLINQGDIIADCTAGLGIDSIALAEKAAHVTCVEIKNEAASALKHNTKSFPNIDVVEGDCRDVIDLWIKEGKRFDCIFIDPARRTENGSRIYDLKQCEPNVVELLPSLSKITPKVIIKASPMLDISYVTEEINSTMPKSVSRIIALGTTTECKELDIICRFDIQTEAPMIHAVTAIHDSFTDFSFLPQEEKNAEASFGMPTEDDLVYDPYPSLMKVGAFKLLCSRFDINEIAPNTHLWCSQKEIDDFTGNTFRVLEVLPYMSKHIKRYASRYPRVGVTVRNFDMSAESLRKKLQVTEGDLRLFAVKNIDGSKFLITCEKI